MANLIVTAHLSGPLAGEDAPKLDSILECAVSRLNGKPSAREGRKMDRSGSPEDWPEVAIPIVRRRLGAWSIAACSDPIVAAPQADGHDFINSRFDPAYAGALAPTSLRKISTSGGEFKSYRLPLRARLVGRVAWLCVGDRKGILKALKRIDSIGKKGSVGYGRVDRWEAEAAAEDLSWFAPHPQTGEPVLMRTLPVGPWLPDGLVGAREDYLAPCPPYWHPGNRTEVVTPC